MKDVSMKTDTLRTATASATVTASPDAIASAKAGTLPKGAVWDVARTAGIIAAKRTSELIPYCHQIPIDHISVEFEPGDSSIGIRTSVRAIWKTGVEMEALTAASVAALTIYDMIKPVDSGVAISDVRLIEKKGGKSDFVETFIPSAAVLVVSDSVAAGRKDDRSGRIIAERLKSIGADVKAEKTVADDQDAIAGTVAGWAKEGIGLIITTGGTGLGPRDVTVEALKKIIEREAPGISEAIRAHGQRRTPYSMLSRGIAGTIGNTMVVTLPGSARGVEESLDAILPHIFHIFPMLAGHGHE